MSRRSLSRDILSVLSSNIITSFISLISVIIIARELGPDGQGLYKSIIVVPMMVISLAELGVRQSIMYYLGRNIYSTNDVFSSLIFIFLFTSLLGGSISYFILSTNSSITNNLFIFLAISYIPVKLLVTYISGIFLGIEHIKEFNKFKWLPSVFNLIGLIFLLLLLKLRVEGALLSFILANLVFTAYAIIKVIKLINFSIKFNHRIICDLLKLGVVYALSLFVIQINNRIDIILLNRLSTLADVGHYSLGVSTSELLLQIPMAFSVIIMSRTANEGDSTEMKEKVGVLFRLSIILALFLSIVFYYLTPLAIPLIYGKQYIPSVKIVQHILPAMIAYVIWKILNARLAGFGKPHIALTIFIPTAIVNILLNYLWIPEYGALGAAWATNISYILACIGIIIAYTKQMEISVIGLFRYKQNDFVHIFNLAKKTLNAKKI